VLTFLAEAQADYPDARAAAKVIETINPLVPMLVLDTKPLREKARQIEAEVRKNLAQQQQSMTSMRTAETAGPGEMYR
jgi:predicted ATP-grasp superfamily ATP-dependent carboligase